MIVQSLTTRFENRVTIRMRPPLSLLWAVVCIIATVFTASNVATSADALRSPPVLAQVEGDPSPSVPAPAAADDKPLTYWIADTFAHTPALMFGLIAVLAAPLFAFAGVMLRARPKPQPQEAATRVLRRSGVAADLKTRTSGDESFAWPAKAWVEVEGAPGGRHEIGLGMVRIGRDDDNEIKLAAKTVHRTHAVVHRTSDADFVVTDVSGAGGNGVIVNGNRVSEARLKHGDRIELGEVALRFISRPA
jgi:hypothetical protein